MFRWYLAVLESNNVFVNTLFLEACRASIIVGSIFQNTHIFPGGETFSSSPLTPTLVFDLHSPKMVDSSDHSVAAAFLWSNHPLIQSLPRFLGRFIPIFRLRWHCEKMFGQIFGLRRPELVSSVRFFPFPGLRQYKKRIIRS